MSDHASMHMRALLCAAEGMGLPKDQFSDAKLANMVKEEMTAYPMKGMLIL